MSAGSALLPDWYEDVLAVQPARHHAVHEPADQLDLVRADFQSDVCCIVADAYCRWKCTSVFSSCHSIECGILFSGLVADLKR